MLTGTIFDMSPGQPDTPCVSKESMSEWMEYLHMQHSIPANVVGVPISIDAVDPNCNFVHIGDTTSDGMSGTFGYAWEPEIAGQYTVTATFMGDDSYGSSFATTYVNVVEASATSTEPTSSAVNFDTINSNMMIGLAAATIAIIIAIVIAVIVVKKK
jgi:hypothetical protein